LTAEARLIEKKLGRSERWRPHSKILPLMIVFLKFLVISSAGTKIISFTKALLGSTIPNLENGFTNNNFHESHGKAYDVKSFQVPLFFFEGDAKFFKVGT